MSDFKMKRIMALVDPTEIRKIKAAAALIGEGMMIFIGRSAVEEAARILRVSEQRKPQVDKEGQRR